MKRDIRARIIQVATFLGGLYFFLEYVTPASVSTEYGWDKSYQPIIMGLTVLSAMAIGLGLINLVRVHGKRATLKLDGWFNSLALIVAMFITLAVTFVTWTKGLEASRAVQPVTLIGRFAQKIALDEEAALPGRMALQERTSILIASGKKQLDTVRHDSYALSQEIGLGEAFYKDVARKADKLSTILDAVGVASEAVEVEKVLSLLKEVGDESQNLAVDYLTLRLKSGESHWSHKAYQILNDGLFIPLGAAMFALLGVYIASAAFRAFRVRSFESALLMMAALLVMLGQISFGTLISEHMPAIRQWLLEVPNSAAFRAIRFGAGIAGVLLAIRMWLSIESRSFSGDTHGR